MLPIDEMADACMRREEAHACEHMHVVRVPPLSRRNSDFYSDHTYMSACVRACVRAWANVAGDPPSKDSNQKTNKQCIHSSKKKKKNRGIALASIACISQSVSPTAHPASGGGQSVVRTSSSRRSSRP